MTTYDHSETCHAPGGADAGEGAAEPRAGDDMGHDGGADRPDGPVRRSSWERLADRLHNERRKWGTVKADTRFVSEPFSRWLEGLSDSAQDMSEDCLRTLGVAMTVALPVRDAIIVSIIAPPEECGLQRMIDFAVRPHTVRNVTGMCGLLERAFTSSRAAPCIERCRNGIAILDRMRRCVPVTCDEADTIPGARITHMGVPYADGPHPHATDGDPESMPVVCAAHEGGVRRFLVQPFAVTAYILWWLGDGKAYDTALSALSIDGRCTLASIVVSAMDHGIAPAWLEGRSPESHVRRVK